MATHNKRDVKTMTTIKQITKEVGGHGAVMSAIEKALFDGMDEGFCIACASFYGNVEPDARRYTCQACNKNEVYSLTEIFI